MATKQTEQQKLIEQFETTAKDAENLLEQVRELATILKTETGLTKESLSNWKGCALTVKEKAKIFASWVEIDIIEAELFLDLLSKDQTNGSSQKT